MTTKPAARRPALTDAGREIAAAIDAAESRAVVVWRGEEIAFRDVPGRVAAIDDRFERNALHRSWLDAVEATNPMRLELLEARRAAARDAGHDSLLAAASAFVDYDPAELAVELERFLADSETVYYAALRRYMALVDIEQGDGTLADIWHLRLGTGWGHWFDPRRVARAIAASVPGADAGDERHGGPLVAGDWRTVDARLATAGARDAADPTARGALGALHGALLAEPAWLRDELGMAVDEIAAFGDYVAFFRLWRLRSDVARLMYELRLASTDDPSVQRAYYAGLLGLLTGVRAAEEPYLADVAEPFASGTRLRSEMLAGMAAEALHRRGGPAWWRDPDATGLVRDLGAATDPDDAVARLGYDRLDWRPVLRLIRTQLIGEMSGYGGPNITTRAGTRKV